VIHAHRVQIHGDRPLAASRHGRAHCVLALSIETFSMRARELQGKVALVTGAGSGIGRATALLFARHGAEVGLFGRTEAELKQAAHEIERDGGTAHVLVGDVADAAAVERSVEQLARAAGRLQIVFANAGVNGVWAPLEELTVEEWQQTLAVNLTGTFLTLKLAAPHLKKEGGSAIVCSSVNGTRMFSNSGASAYACSKAGQVALVKMLAVELGASKVRVNAVCPGAIDTDISENTRQRNIDAVKPRVEFPEGRIPLTGGTPGRPEQVAELVLFLASERSSHITGSEIWVDGGQSLLEG
jgi:NAD(P)-dependent dehydrogenase (short-subunit alcohol dehydrogenase family)